jgi:hypothetical protein
MLILNNEIILLKKVIKIENEIIKLIATQGAFAILFSYLLFYVLKENSKREKNYQKIIKELSDSIPTIKNGILEIIKKIKKE